MQESGAVHGDGETDESSSSATILFEISCSLNIDLSDCVCFNKVPSQCMVMTKVMSQAPLMLSRTWYSLKDGFRIPTRMQ